MKYVFITGLLSGALLIACNNQDTANTEHSGVHDSGTNHAMHDSTIEDHNTTMMGLMNQNMQEMKAVPSTGNINYDFAALMKIHHKGAIDMARAQLEQGKDADLKAMAQKMIDDQQREIMEFDTFLSANKATAGDNKFHTEAMEQMTLMNMEMDHAGAVDKQFAQMMIQHHRDGIDMAKAYLKLGASEASLKKMANNIISSQQKEIGEMDRWLSKNGQ